MRFDELALDGNMKKKDLKAKLKRNGSWLSLRANEVFKHSITHYTYAECAAHITHTPGCA